MAKIAEYGTVDGEPKATKTVLETGTGHMGRKIELVHISAGWAIAGSCLRWDEEAYGVSFEFDGATHGRRFKAEADARAMFAKWTA